MSKTWSPGAKLPHKEKQKTGKWDEQLALTIGVNELQLEDGDSPAGPEQSGQ